jgi:glycosyltransferase involved in cell wall biosynthesis
MRILFLSDNFPPEVNAPATRTYEHCLEWVKLGAEVTVITCNPNFPQGKLHDGHTNSIYKKEIIDGIKVIRVWSFISANVGFLKRSLDYLSYALMATVIGSFQKTDIIVATSPQFFTTWAGCFLGFVKRKPWVFELRDLWPESITTVGAMKKGRLYSLLEKIELYLYRSASVVIPNTPAFKLNLVSRGINENKIHVIPNGANTKLFQFRTKDVDLLKELYLEGKFIFGYIGTHGMAHSLDFIMDAISEIDNPTIHFLFVGDGAAKKDILLKANELNLKNVTFLDPVTKDEISRYISIIDVALVPLKASDTFKTVIPSKIFESCAMRKPILLGVDGQARELVEEFDVGLYFEPENKDSFKVKVEIFSSDYQLYDKLSANCVELVQQYDRGNLAIEMYIHLQQLAYSKKNDNL